MTVPSQKAPFVDAKFGQPTRLLMHQTPSIRARHGPVDAGRDEKGAARWHQVQSC